MPDILLTLFLLLVFPLRNILRSLRPGGARPRLEPLREYWRQARFLVALLGAFLVVAWLQGHTPFELGLALPPPQAGMWGLLIALGMVPIVYAIGHRMDAKMPADRREQERQQLRDLPFALPRTRTELAVFVVTMVSMTTAWEVLYRGYLLLVLAPLVGMPVAVIVSAVAYGAGHGYANPKQFVMSIVMALAFTSAYALSGSLWWLIVLHALAPISMLFAVRKLTGNRRHMDSPSSS